MTISKWKRRMIIGFSVLFAFGYILYLFRVPQKLRGAGIFFSQLPGSLFDWSNNPPWAPNENTIPYLSAAKRNDAIGMRILRIAHFGFNQDELRRAVAMAASHGSTDILKLFIPSAYPLNARVSEYDTPFAVAFSHGQCKTALWLLEQGATPEIPQYSQRQSQSKAAQPQTECLELNEKIQQWKHNPQDLGVSMVIALERKDFSTAKQLLENGADPNQYLPGNAYNDKKRTAMHIAVLQGNTRAINLLAEKNARFDVHDKDSYTPLQYAIALKDFGLIHLLLSKGANPYTGNTCTDHYSGYYGHDEGLMIDISEFAYLRRERLKQSGDTKTDENNFSPTDDLHLIRMFEEFGADIKNFRNCKGATLLHLEATNAKKVEYLVSRGLRINDKDLDGKTMLHYVVFSKHNQEEVIRKAVSLGADINAVDNEGRTALAFAAINSKAIPGARRAAKGLLDCGANPDIPGKDGRTAIFTSDPSLVKRMIQVGGNPNAIDKQGGTALTYFLSKEKRARDITTNHNSKYLIYELLEGGINPDLGKYGEETTRIIAGKKKYEIGTMIANVKSGNWKINYVRE